MLSVELKTLFEEYILMCHIQPEIQSGPRSGQTNLTFHKTNKNGKFTKFLSQSGPKKKFAHRGVSIIYDCTVRGTVLNTKAPVILFLFCLHVISVVQILLYYICYCAAIKRLQHTGVIIKVT